MDILNPQNDGVDHLNIYSKARTKLGRLLSNFAHTPFSCEDGDFESVEGYWYWLSCPATKEREVLRTLHGYMAKQKGKELRGVDFPVDDEFRQKIRKAITAKLMRHRDILEMLVKSDLPLVHYYCYGQDPNMKVVADGKSDWLIEFIEQIRVHFKAKRQE